MLKQSLIFAASLLTSISVFAAPAPGALPVGGSVTSGSVSFSGSSGNLQINQNSPTAIIHWQSFNVGSQAKVHFQQVPNGIALNRVNPAQGVSQIYGQLSATGKIILVNQAGIYFGPSARVNVGGIIASTSDITDKNFLAGKYSFDQPSSQQGSVINQGSIIARDNGLVALVGTSVSNEGYIQARGGHVVLASGNKFTVSLSGDQLVNFTVDEAASTTGKDQDGQALKHAVNNSGKIIADGGTILMTAQSARRVVDGAINMSGIAEAKSVSEKNGLIILSANDDVSVSGKIDVSGKQGGTVKVLGNRVAIQSTAVINASGANGGGTILIGGNYQGKGPETHAKQTRVAKGAVLKADAGVKGDGGKVIVWSDDDTAFHGAISAKGGALGGNGGLVETSGGYLDVTDGTVNTLASHGKTGTWLLDPTNMYIAVSSASAIGAGMSGSDSLTLTGTLVGALVSTNVQVVTPTSGVNAGDLTVVDPISWSSNNTLTLSAANSIFVKAAITNTANGNLILKTDTAGSGTAQLAFSGPGAVNLTGGAATIYYNPTTFGTQDLFPITAGGGVTQYMLINSLDTGTRSLAFLSDPLNSALWSRNFALSANIEAGATSGWNGGLGFLAIGTSGTNFTGKFDGQNHTINNLFMDMAADGGGFFGYATNASISNVGLTNANFVNSNSGINMGILVGTAMDTAITNAYTTGNLTNFGDDARTGGLAGAINGTTAVSDSYSIANLSTSGGGVYQTIGGLVGSLFSSSSIANSYSGGTITDTGNSPPNYVGGLAGENQNLITDSYSATTMTINAPTANIGGLVGFNITPTAVISNSYSYGRIRAIGGGAYFQGGLVGMNSGTVNNSYWNVGTTGQTTSAGGGVGMTTAQLQSGLPAGLSSSLWGIIPGQSFPYLKSFYAGGTPRAISGYAPGGGVGVVNNGIYTVQLASNGNDVSNNGITQGLVSSGDDGYYYYLIPKDVIPDGSALITYIPISFPSNSVTVAPNGGGSITGLNLNASTVTVGDNNVNTITNTTLINAISGLAGGPGILYAATPTSVTLNLSISFMTTATTSYDIDNEINVSGEGAQININGPLTINGNVGGSISVANGQTVTIGAAGNVSQITGSTSNIYNISGIVGTISGGGGTNQYILNQGGSITNLSGGGTDTLTLNTTGNNTWTLNGTSGGVSGAANITSFSNMIHLVGGSGNDTFQLTAPSTVTINGGGGSNTLISIPGSDGLFNISGGNSGVTGATGFNNIQNLTGSATGTNRFIFTGVGFLTGVIDGGNVINENVIDVSGKSSPVNLKLGDPVGGVINSGIMSTAEGPVAIFTQVQRGIGNGGTLTLPTGKTMSDVTFDLGSLTSGFIGDPFFFSGFTIAGPPAVSSTHIANIITAPQLSQDAIEWSSDENALIMGDVERNISELVNTQLDLDAELLATTYCAQ